ncbi:MAG: 3-keto-5-aminohexanoate cleavage protein [Proteobacteria bacterium]|nr:MAG: 3-keto-5-aminohexanoate cleavage protein [Pseudomonadota bacterium]
MKPVIITVAITGSVPQKAHNPAVPVTVSEQIEATHAAYEAGAAMVHLHVRHDDGSTSADPDRFRLVQEGIRAHCPDMLVQFSTGGRSASGSERGAMLAHRPDMASLATGSCNFPTIVYANPPALIEELAGQMRAYDIKPEIEVFDVAMLFNAARYVREGVLSEPLHVQFVMGVKNALPARRDLLEFQVGLLGELLPRSTWVAAGIGRTQHEVSRWALELGGHVRTGMEDNIRLDRHTLAPSNAALVERAVALAAEHDRRPATATEARAILGVRPAPPPR